MSSGISYPRPTYIPPLSIFNPINFPVNTPTTGSSGGGGSQSNIFPNGLSSGNVIQFDGGTGGSGGTGLERSINGISYLNFIDTANTTPVGAPVLTSISQTNNTFTIGGTNAIGINITGSALTFNGTPVGTGSGNVSTATDNTYANLTSQNFFNASVSQGLTFSNALTGIVLNNSLVFQNNSSATENILLSYATNSGNLSNWTFSSQNSNVNMNFSFPSASIELSSSFINLNPSSGVILNGLLQNNLGQSYSTNLIPSRGSYLFDNVGSPFIAYNIGGTITSSPLVISSTLSNYATLTGGTTLVPQTFSGVNSFTGTITAPTQLTSDNSTNVATTAFVNSTVPTLLNNYATLTGGTYAIPQTFSGFNQFNNGLNIGAFPIQYVSGSIPNSIPTGVPDTGFALGWNLTVPQGGGETDFISYGQQAGDIGGFDFYAVNQTSTSPTQIAQLRATRIVFNLTPTQPAQTYPITGNDNASATIGYVNSAVGTGNFSITSTNTSTNSWSFTIPNNYGYGFTYNLYTTGIPVAYNTGGGTQPTWSAGNITLQSNSIFFVSGNGVYQPYTSTSSAFLDFCGGFQNTHTATGSGGAYIMNIISSMGASASWTINSNSITTTGTQSGNLPCPAQASSPFTTNYTITFSSSLASACSAVLTGNIVIPS